MDGLVFSDHTPTPGLIEYKKATEPVQVLRGTNRKVRIINRYDHVTLDHLKCEWTLVGDGFRKSGKEVKIPTGSCGQAHFPLAFDWHRQGIQPGETSELEIQLISDRPRRECYLELSFTLREGTYWAKSGHEVAFGQLPVLQALTFRMLKALKPSTAPKYSQVTPQVLEIMGSGIIWQFNIVHGSLVSWKKSGEELIHTPPTMDFYRALTDNDRPTQFGQSWRSSRLHQTKCHVRSVNWSATETGVVIKVASRIAPPVLANSIDTVFTYTFTDKHVSIKVSGEPKGLNLPNTFARIGLTLSLNNIEKVDWFGRGPGESYRDKKLSQRYGNYSAPIKDLFTDYEFPQETGNRTDVRWVSFSGQNGTGLKAYFADLEEASFSALHYTTNDLDECKHPYELYKRKRKETIVKLDWAHHGLGTGSCGPATLPQYELKSGPFEYEILLE
jgi:beta-galactosidase